MEKIFFILFLLTSSQLVAQSEALLVDSISPVVIQPRVMVIPFAKADQNIREVYEHQYGGPIRVAVTKVKEALDKKGIQTIDFRAILNQINNQELITGDQQTSIKERIIERSAADIYIESETQVIQTPTGNSVTVILTAYDAFTGLSLANKLGHSPKFYTHNYEKLTEKALDTFLDDFTTSLLESFQYMLTNGRIIAVDIGISEGSEMDMDSEIGDSDDLLSDILESWLEDNAHRSYFHIQGITATKMIIDEVKIPAFDPATNKYYRPSKFASKLRKFLLSQGLEVTRDVQGGKVFITING